MTHATTHPGSRSGAHHAALLDIQDLRAYYRTEAYGISRTVRAVDGVSMQLFPDEIYGVAGESSCGKTTLIKVISGTIKPPLRIESGHVRYRFGAHSGNGLGEGASNGDEVDMLTASPDDLRRNVRWKDPIQRYKGLGEMDADQLAETTMDPRHRTLRKLTIDDVDEAARVFDLLMGSDVAPRKEFIVQGAYEVDVEALDA